ncbi:DUF2946 family protein [Variovorax paradoxus]|uniref:DUF2946 domain-containing protein n=1 Tax=Variovorax paradoxus (strain EPS) TaxID=595537 RepID=E6V656_VARPE|nr:DUF2946 family protein [Variovorax paradoxus]ADU38291.1 hypothetical protein Varpa_4120 [Variovorax paradoxus EPS]
MPLRPLPLQRLLRLLLLAVFFNAAIGMPLHEAGHMREAVESMAQAAGLDTIADDAASEADAPAHGDQENHRVCECCLAHVHFAAAPARLPAALEVVQTTALPRAPPGMAFEPFAGRWPFASRAPPNAST